MNHKTHSEICSKWNNVLQESIRTDGEESTQICKCEVGISGRWPQDMKARLDR